MTKDKLTQYFVRIKSWRDQSLISKVWTDQYPAENKRAYRLSWCEKSVMSLLILLNCLTLGRVKWYLFKDKEEDKEKRTQFSEGYVLFRFAVLALLVIFPFASWFYFVIVTYLLVGVFVYPLYILFVEKYDEEWSQRSKNRTLILLFINYIEMIMGFAALYVFTRSIGDNTYKVAISNPCDAIYFSSVTITTLGYGDFVPINGTGKMLITFETIAGLIFIVLVVAIFVSFLSLKREKIYHDS